MLLLVRSVRALPTTHEPGRALVIIGPSEPSILGGIKSLLSCTYINQAYCNCLRLLIQTILCALCFALLNAGNSIAARIAIMARTTRSSISLKAEAGVHVSEDVVPNGGNFFEFGRPARPRARQTTPSAWAPRKATATFRWQRAREVRRE